MCSFNRQSSLAYHVWHSIENAIDLNEYQTELDTDTDHADDHPPREDHNSTQTDNQLEDSGMSALECLEKVCPPAGMEDVVGSEVVEGAGTQGSTLLRHESILTLAKPIVDDLLPCTSDSGKVTKSVRFADQLSMPDTECRDTPECHRVISEVDRDTRSDCFTDQPTRGAISHAHLKSTTHQRQPLREKTKRQGENKSLQA